MTRPETTDAQEDLEAAARRLMATIAATPNRGFDTAKERHRLIGDLDAVLDAYNGHTPPTKPKPKPDTLSPEYRVYLRNAHTGDPGAVDCGVCGRTRYVATLTGIRVCIGCDHILSGSWSAIDDTP